MSFTPGLQLPYGITPVNPVPVDGYSGPYATTAEAIASIPQAIRFPTMEVRLADGVDNRLYWFKDGVTDEDLVEFSASSALSITFVANPQNTTWLINSPADFDSGNNANPTLYVFRGELYKFKVAASIGHTLQIRSASGAVYSIGMPPSGMGSNSQTSGGHILWTVPFDAPDDLFYVCTAHSTVMKGHIRVIPSLVAPITPSAEQGNAAQVAYTNNTGTYTLASPIPITKAIHIDSTVCISVNGVRRLLTDSNTSPFYFGRTGGATQLLLTQVQAGDSLYVRPAYLEHGLETTDIILLEYFSGGTITLVQPQPSGTYHWANGNPYTTSGTYVPAGSNIVSGSTGFTFSTNAKYPDGSPAGNIMAYLSARQIGSTISAFNVLSSSSNYGTWTITSVQPFGPDLIVMDTTFVSGAGMSGGLGDWAFTFTP